MDLKVGDVEDVLDETRKQVQLSFEIHLKRPV